MLGYCVLECGPRPTGPSSFVLVENGKSDAEIVIESTSVAMVRYAAEEFRDYVKKTSGADIPIAEVGRDYKAPADGKHRVFIGEKPPYTRLLGLDVSKLRPDGFYVRITPDALILVGRDEPVPYIENKNPIGRYEMGVNQELKLSAIWSNRFPVCRVSLPREVPVTCAGTGRVIWVR